MIPIFDNKAIARAITAEIDNSSTPQNHRHTFSLVSTTDGIKAVLTERINKDWVVKSIVDVNYDGHLNAEVELKGSW